MPDATNLQTSFLGGEIAPSFQGRADHPKYKSGMTLCFNSLPVETGAWVRRPGTRVAALTRAGLPAKIIDFDFSQNAPYTAEFTDSHLRFFNGYSLVHTNDAEVVQSVSTANPAVVTVNGNTIFSNGDMAEFAIRDPLNPDQGSLLENRQFLLGSVSGATVALFDPVTGVGIDGSTLNFTAGTPATINRILGIATPYTVQMLPNIRAVQALNGNINTMVLLHKQVPTQALTGPLMPACRDVAATTDFALNAASFIDGPYFDPPATGPTITPSAVSGAVNLVASSPLFAVTDIGRSIRLLSQPANWAVGTAYTTGNLVTYQNAYYVALQASTGAIPGTDAINWGVATNASAWVWAIITAFTDNEHVAATIQVVNTATTQLPGVLVNTNAIPSTNWRLGLFSNTTGYAAVGTYHEGRLWLSGLIGNRIDGSVSNDIFNFSPTAVDGTVADNNAIDYTFNAEDINAIFWMTPQQTGIIVGTQAGEWLVQASTAGDILTPTSIQAKRVTKYGDANVEPINAPFATLFVARNNKKVFEYLADVFTGKYSAINVSLTGSHLTAPGVDEIRYQKELAPIAWFRMDDGSLAGMTYRRESPMLSEQPAFAGWHSHKLGTNRAVTSIAVGPNVTGDLDTLSMVTLDPVDKLYRVELMTDLFPDNGTNLDAWFVDGGTTPPGAYMTPTQLTLYGLHNFEGQNLAAYVAGVDAGNYTVTNGQVIIALPAAGGLLTETTIQAASDLDNTDPSALQVAFGTTNSPVTPTSLQSYIGPTTPVTGVQNDNILVDVLNSRVFEFKQGSTSTDGIRVLDINSGLQTNAATHDQIFGASTTNFVLGPYALGYDGNIYFPNEATNSTIYLQLDPSILRVIGTAGKSGGSLVAAPNNIPFPNNLAPMRVCGRSFLVAPSLVASVKSISVVETTAGSMQNAGHAFVMDEGAGYSCGSYDGGNNAYTVAKAAGATTTSLGVYKTVIQANAGSYSLAQFPTVQNPFIATTKLGTIAPATIDATWTHISAISSPAYDQSDGNLLLFVQTGDSVTNKQYLMKINSVTAAIMWQIAVVGFPSDAIYNMAASYIAFGQFAFVIAVSGTCTYYLVNTIAGTTTTTAIPGFSNANASVFDARLGSIFFNAQFTQTGGSPILLNATPTTYTAQWARLLNVTGRQFCIVPAMVGTTFTSKGQLLRPLAPQETGARNGPALGKTRRNHRIAALLLNTAGISFGTTFDKLHAGLLKSAGGTPFAANQLYSNVFTYPLEDNNSYDGMLCWQITRPYPATVLSVQGFVETQDR